MNTKAKIIAMGSDHSAYEYRVAIKKELEKRGYEIIDYGQHVKRPIKDTYRIGEKVALSVSKGEAGKGILLCGSGIGMSIVANKIPGCFASLCYNIYGAIKAREHNDANILTMGARFIGLELAKEIVYAWLKTDFGGQRHTERRDLVSEIDKTYRRFPE